MRNECFTKEHLRDLETRSGTDGLSAVTPRLKLNPITNSDLLELESIYGLYRLGKSDKYTAVHGTVVYLNFYDAEVINEPLEIGDEPRYKVKFYPINVYPYLPEGTNSDQISCSISNPTSDKKIEVEDMFHLRRYLDLYNSFVEFNAKICKIALTYDSQVAEAGYVMENKVWKLPSHLSPVEYSKDEADECKVADECCEVDRSFKRNLLRKA